VKLSGAVKVMVDLAGVYATMQKNRQAEELFREAALLCRSKGLFLRCANDLAKAFSRKVRHEEALKGFKIVFEKSAEFRGGDHPYILIRMCNLAIASGGFGKVREAIALLTRATKVLNRDTTGLKANVAGFMVDVGGFDKV
jgi:tetratricopeptide (TPR) repeat protein